MKKHPMTLRLAGQIRFNIQSPLAVGKETTIMIGDRDLLSAFLLGRFSGSVYMKLGPAKLYGTWSAAYGKHGRPPRLEIGKSNVGALMSEFDRRNIAIWISDVAIDDEKGYDEAAVIKSYLYRTAYIGRHEKVIPRYDSLRCHYGITRSVTGELVQCSHRPAYATGDLHYCGQHARIVKRELAEIGLVDQSDAKLMPGKSGLFRGY